MAYANPNQTVIEYTREDLFNWINHFEELNLLMSVLKRVIKIRYDSEAGMFKPYGKKEIKKRIIQFFVTKQLHVYINRLIISLNRSELI